MCKLTKSLIGDRNGTYLAIMLPFLWHMAYGFMAYVPKKAGSESKVGKKSRANWKAEYDTAAHILQK